MRRALVPTLLMMVACTGAGGGDGGGGDDSGDGGASDGGSTDGGTETSGALLPLSSDCSTHFPLDNPGVVWTWTLDGDPDTGTIVQTALGQEDYRGQSAWAVEVVLDTAEAAAPENTHHQVDRSWFRCDAQGAWLLGWSSEVETVNSGDRYEWNTWIHYLEPGLRHPKDMAEGDSWTFDFQLEYKSGHGYSDSVTFQVTGSEAASVGAGDFDCLRVTSTVGDDYCAAPGVGAVLLPEATLESVTREE